MKLEIIGCKPSDLYIQPCLLFAGEIIFTDRKEAILAIDGYLKSDDNKIISELKELPTEDSVSEKYLAARGTSYDNLFKERRQRVEFIVLIDKPNSIESVASAPDTVAKPSVCIRRAGFPSSVCDHSRTEFHCDSYFAATFLLNHRRPLSWQLQRCNSRYRSLWSVCDRHIGEMDQRPETRTSILDHQCGVLDYSCLVRILGIWSA